MSSENNREEIIMTREPAICALNRHETAALLKTLELKSSGLSPFPVMIRSAAPDKPGRSTEEILSAAMQSYDAAEVRRQIDVVARPDRFLETRLSLFGTVPETAVAHSSRAAGGEFTLLRPHDTFDAEMVFPFSAAEILQWAQSQIQFTLGQKIHTSRRVVLNHRELTALLAVLDAWKVRQGESFVLREPLDPDSVEVTERQVMEALAAGREGKDRRFLVTVVEEALRLLVRPGNIPAFGLADADRTLLREGLAFWEEQGEVTWNEEGKLMIHPTLCQIASSFYSWISHLSFHDVQIVSGGHGNAEAREDFIMAWCTPMTVWILAVEGLSGWVPNDPSRSGTLRFELRSCDVPEAIAVLDAYLKPVESVSIDPSLYAPEAVEPTPPTQTPAAAYCRQCGNKLKPAARFCNACGSAVQ